MVIKRRLLCPEAEEDLQPLLAARVTVVRRVLRLPKHVALGLVPTADNVQAEAATADMIRRNDLLRREHWRKKRHVHSAEHREALGGSQQAAGPGHRLAGAALEIGRAAIALSGVCSG
jgi:hypothetical protein